LDWDNPTKIENEKKKHEDQSKKKLKMLNDEIENK
jgi:hypothetical protein